MSNNIPWDEVIRLQSGGGRRTAHELVRDSLRSAILRGALGGGSRLVQADIAAALDVSTTPVREALRDLATEGLIRLDAHRGAIVASLTRDEVRDIYDLRLLLEPEALRRASQRITPEEIAVAEAIIERMEAEDDPAAWAELNAEFHETLIAASGSPRLVEILDRLRASSAPYVAVSVGLPTTDVMEANKQHRELLDALRAGDGERAVLVVEAHLTLTLRLLEDSEAPLA